ncbi:hypothetical protein M8818_000284 [Zalaria obscura]|uniref:Uncharacterized protein n=1 Tax=Zalaria obscura TaxID=2024903 RepID=A0ACC3SPL3_9PEZI
MATAEQRAAEAAEEARLNADLFGEEPADAQEQPSPTAVPTTTTTTTTEAAASSPTTTAAPTHAAETTTSEEQREDWTALESAVNAIPSTPSSSPPPPPTRTQPNPRLRRHAAAARGSATHAIAAAPHPLAGPSTATATAAPPAPGPVATSSGTAEYVPTRNNARRRKASPQAPTPAPDPKRLRAEAANVATLASKLDPAKKPEGEPWGSWLLGSLVKTHGRETKKGQILPQRGECSDPKVQGGMDRLQEKKKRSEEEAGARKARKVELRARGADPGTAIAVPDTRNNEGDDDVVITGSRSAPPAQSPAAQVPSLQSQSPWPQRRRTTTPAPPPAPVAGPSNPQQRAVLPSLNGVQQPLSQVPTPLSQSPWPRRRNIPRPVPPPVQVTGRSESHPRAFLPALTNGVQRQDSWQQAQPVRAAAGDGDRTAPTSACVCRWTV